MSLRIRLILLILTASMLPVFLGGLLLHPLSHLLPHLTTGSIGMYFMLLGMLTFVGCAWLGILAVKSFFHPIQELKNKTIELEKLNAEFRKHSTIDPLTGLLNRHGIQTELSHEIARAERYGHSIFALLIDIDDFKNVNERLGYAVGDQILCEISAKLLKNLRK